MIMRQDGEGKITTKFLTEFLYFFSLFLYSEKQTTFRLLMKYIPYTPEGTSI